MANFWGGSWGTSWAASWDLREALPEPVAPTLPAGSGVRRRKPRAYIEIDEELFPVESEQEAQALLKKARKTAKEVVARVQQEKLPPVQIPIVTAKGSEQLERLAAQTQAYVAEQYKKARAIQDDDDDIEVLLLSL